MQIEILGYLLLIKMLKVLNEWVQLRVPPLIALH
jgi:hypothetical protein